jgi:hypothetical protein
VIVQSDAAQKKPPPPGGAGRVVGRDHEQCIYDDQGRSGWCDWPLPFEQLFLTSARAALGILAVYGRWESLRQLLYSYLYRRVGSRLFVVMWCHVCCLLFVACLLSCGVMFVVVVVVCCCSCSSSFNA